MEYILIFNGLGNQMSQYAYFLSKKLKSKHCHVIYNKNEKAHNGFELSNVFGIKMENTLITSLLSLFYFRLRHISIIEKFFSPFYNIIYEPKNYDYSQELLYQELKGINFYFGGWHSEKNFMDIENEVRQVFEFPVPNPNEKSDYSDLFEKIKNDNHSVSLHIRRGDYVNIKPDDYWQFGGVATDTYYKNAINYINNHVKDPFFYIFSNDVEWCRKNLDIQNSIIVTCNQGDKSWRDMHLMSLCNHHILANSSFSWWGAWLSKKNGITVHPKWFIRDVETKDFYPERWITV